MGQAYQSCNTAAQYIFQLQKSSMFEKEILFNVKQFILRIVDMGLHQ